MCGLYLLLHMGLGAEAVWQELGQGPLHIGTVLRSGETAEENGEGKGHKLGDEQSQQQPCAVQAQGRAIGGCHIDDGVNAVNEEEKGDEVDENVLFR